MKKKLLLKILAFCIISSLFSGRIYIHAANTLSLDISNIDYYVIGGLGTEDSPYILNDNNPYKPLLDAVALKEYIKSVISSNLQVNTLASEGTFNSKTKIYDSVKRTYSLTLGGY